jgi:hypothetical protein
MPFKFTTAAKAAPKSVTFADVPVGGFFQTSYGRVYVKATGGEAVKLGHPGNAGANQVTVKPASYFGSRTDITLLGDLTLAI